MRTLYRRARAEWLAGVILACAIPATSSAGMIEPCGGNCIWSIVAGGVQVANGDFEIDPTTGDIGFASPVKVGLGGGAWASINSLSGNADPILNFNIAAAAGTNGRTFSFTFSLPASLEGEVRTISSTSYSLTAGKSVGAQLTPLKQHTAVAQYVDTTVGGESPLNAGVDVGDKFFFTGAGTQSSPSYTAQNTQTLSSAFDLMSVTLGFSLSPNTTVGVSGFLEATTVDQNPAPVPLPASAWLLALGFLGWCLFNQADTQLIHGGAKLRGNSNRMV